MKIQLHDKKKEVLCRKHVQISVVVIQKKKIIFLLFRRVKTNFYKVRFTQNTLLYLMDLRRSSLSILNRLYVLLYPLSGFTTHLREYKKFK